MAKDPEEESKRIEAIKKNTDPSMEEMGTVIVHGFGYGEREERMTRREAMLRGLMERTGPTEAWVSDKSKEEQKQKEEAERQRIEAEKAKKIEDIKNSTDPSMEEIVTLNWRGHPNIAFGGSSEYEITVTKREQLLIEMGALNKYEIFEKQKQENVEKNQLEVLKENIEKENALLKEINEILTSEDPEMENIVGCRMYDSFNHPAYADRKYFLANCTKRQKLLYELGALPENEVKALFEQNKNNENVVEQSDSDKIIGNDSGDGRLWIVPNNDLEAKAIIDMLKRKNANFMVTGQKWGASWENLEEHIKNAIENAKKAGRKIYGVELCGDLEGVINIDHHIYGEDDRSNPNSSLEQVAEILGVDLSFDEQFVSANDKGYTDAMKKLAADLGLSSEDAKAIIVNIRMRERKQQGITLVMEAQALDAIESLGEISEKQDYIQLDLQHSKTATITDRLYNLGIEYDNLLITSADGETNFFGKTEVINKLMEKFPGSWSGGQLDQGSGYWGIGGKPEEMKTVQMAIKNEVQMMINGTRANTNKKEDISRDDEK